MISLFDKTLSDRRIIMWQRSFYFIRPIALFSFNHQLSGPALLVLGWAKYHFDWCSFSTVGFKFSYFRVNSKLYAGITGKVSIKFGIGFVSICQLKFNTCWLVDCCYNFKFIIDERRNEEKIASEYPFTTIFSPNLKLSLNIDRFE